MTEGEALERAYGVVVVVVDMVVVVVWEETDRWRMRGWKGVSLVICDRGKGSGKGVRWWCAAGRNWIYGKGCDI